MLVNRASRNYQLLDFDRRLIQTLESFQHSTSTVDAVLVIR